MPFTAALERGVFHRSSQTSVPGARFHRFGRKFHHLCAFGLPYRALVFTILDGSFTLCAPLDFRTGRPFSPFWTEVSLPVPSPTSVPGARIILYSFVFMVIPKIVLFLLESVRFRFDIFLYFIIIII